MRLFLIILLLSFPAFAVETESPEDQEERQLVSKIVVLISSQIRPCWKIPLVANPMPLEAIVNIDKKGNLKFVEFSTPVTSDQEEMAKSIKEAIADPKCNPITNKPPVELYEYWENLPLLFAPKK